MSEENIQTDTVTKQPSSNAVKQDASVEMAPTGFFGGFNIKYPEYEVLTPQTLETYTIRGLNVQEEENLKGSLVTPRKIPDHINNCIFSTLVKKPQHIKTLDDFLKYTTVKDRDALLYGLYHITYKDIHNYDITCQKCEKQYTVSVKISDVFSMDAYTGEVGEILNQRIEVKLPTIPNTIAVIKQPTLNDENIMLNDMLFQSDKSIEMGIEMLVVDKFIINKGTRNEQVLDSMDNIFRGYTTLPALDRKKINEAYLDSFGKFTIQLVVTSNCSHCGHGQETNLDLVQQFFRSMYE